MHQRIDGQRPVRADQQRVAVRLRVRDELSADAAASAAAIFHDNRLVQLLRHLVADQAADDVGITPGRERHDHVDRPVRIGGEGALRQQSDDRRQTEAGDEGATRDGHAVSSLTVAF